MSDAPHVASLTILAGPLKGHTLPVDEAVDDLLVGCDPDCRFVVSLPGVSPVHARIWLDPAGATVYNTRSARGVYVNDAQVADQAPLRDGDILWLGAPGEPESVMIQFRHHASAAPAGAVAEPVAVEPAAGDDWLIEELEGGADSASALPVEAEPAMVEDGFFVEDAAAAGAPPPAPVADEGEGYFFEDVASGPAVEASPEAAPNEWRAASNPETFVFDEPGPEAAAAPAAEVFQIDEPPSAAPAPLVLAPPAPATVAPPEAPPPRAPTPPTPAPEARAPRPRPPAERPTPRPAAGRPGAAPARRVPAAGGSALKWIGIGVGLLVLVVVGVLLARRLTSGPRLEAVEPARARVGDRVSLRGRNLSPEPGRNVVRFDGEREARVLSASLTRLEVEVPEIPLPPGGSKAVAIVATVNGADAGSLEILLSQGPRLHGISPSVAMPGEEVVLAGTGWGSSVKVAFGPYEAPLVEVTPSSIRVQVPPGAPPAQGTSLPVTVTSGDDASNAAPFVVGRLPLLTAIEPGSASPGDVLTIRGRGFPLQTGWNDLRIGGVRALVASAVESELKAVVPWVEGGGGAVTVELRVPGTENVGTGTLTMPPPSDTVGFRFSASRFEDAAGHDHVALTTPLGPAFVLSGSAGRTAGERALLFLGRLNEAAVPLKSTLSSDLEVRGLEGEGEPWIGLVGQPAPLLEASEEDAAAHEEGWSGPKGRAGPVTRESLATWWGAVARDLVLLLVRGERPRHAAALAPEGRALQELHDTARKTGRFGLPVEVVAGLRPGPREALRALGLRLPPALRGPANAANAPASVAGFSLPGIWSGWESESGERKYVTLNFSAEGGTLTYERALSLTLPLLSVEQPRRGTVRYALQSGARARYYEGAWDGQKIRGRIFSDAERSQEVGVFELERKR